VGIIQLHGLNTPPPIFTAPPPEALDSAPRPTSSQADSPPTKFHLPDGPGQRREAP